MAVDWSKYFVGCLPSSGKLFIGRGEYRDGKFKMTSASEDRTEEIVLAVMNKMRVRMKRKCSTDHALQYRVEGLGTLAFIDNGYKAVIAPMPRK